MKEKKIRKSRDKVLCGVAGGIAEYLGIDPLWIRICFGRKSEGKGGESECLRSCLQSLCCCFCSG